MVTRVLAGLKTRTALTALGAIGVLLVPVVGFGAKSTSSGSARAASGEASEPRTFPRTRSAAIPRRGCGDLTTGAAPPRQWRSAGWLVAGPIGFAGLVERNGVALADMPELFEPKPGERWAGTKAGAGLKRGKTVTITVPKSERRHLRLLYAATARERRASPHAVTLAACAHAQSRGHRHTGFPGGFSVAGPRCSKLRIRVHGRKPPLTRHVSFGAGECPSRTTVRGR